MSTYTYTYKLGSSVLIPVLDFFWCSGTTDINAGVDSVGYETDINPRPAGVSRNNNALRGNVLSLGINAIMFRTTYNSEKAELIVLLKVLNS